MLAFQSPERAPSTKQTMLTIAVSGSDALVAAITGGIARSPISTAGPPSMPSTTATVPAIAIATSAGGEISWMLSSDGGGLTSSISRAINES